MRNLIICGLILLFVCGCEPISTALGVALTLFLPNVSYHCPAETGYTCISSYSTPSLFENLTGSRFPWADTYYNY